MATVPSEVTAVAGTILTAATWNSNVRDAINFIISPPIFVLRQTVAQSLTNGVFAAMLWDTEDIDRDGGHSTTTNTSRYTAQTAGWYLVTGTASTVATGTSGTRRIAHWMVNGSAINGGSTQVPPIVSAANPTVWPAASREIYLNVGDYLELGVYHDETTARSTFVSSDGQPAFTGKWMST